MKIRLFVNSLLGVGQDVALGDQAHYLNNVMRRKPGDEVFLFNGRDGEWRAEIQSLNKRSAVLRCDKQSAPQRDPPDLWLLFAPVKKARTDFIVEKATELGAARILPVQTQYTNSDRIRFDKMRAHAIEAAEQCGGTFVPEIGEYARLDKVLADWPSERKILFCDETQSAPSVTEVLSGEKSGPWAILIGPEGGFSQDEADLLRGLPYSIGATLGPRILRAETAAVSALTIWQALLGDWG